MSPNYTAERMSPGLLRMDNFREIDWLNSRLADLVFWQIPG